MKRLLAILCLVLLSSYSYSQEVIPEVETVTKDGLVYHQSSTEPFTGIVEWFHDNHRVGSRKNYIDGELDGLYEYFHENGQLNVRGNYVDGVPDGLFEDFDEDGNLTKTETWENGEVVEYNLNP